METEQPRIASLAEVLGAEGMVDFDVNYDAATLLHRRLT